MAEFKSDTLKPKGEADQEGKSTVNTSHDDSVKNSYGNNNRASAGNGGNVQNIADQEGQKTGGAIMETEENKEGKDGNVVKSQELSHKKSENGRRASDPLRKEQVHGNLDQTTESVQNRQSSSSGKDSQMLHGTSRRQENDAPILTEASTQRSYSDVTRQGPLTVQQAQQKSTKQVIRNVRTVSVSNQQVLIGSQFSVFSSQFQFQYARLDRTL